jgi:phage terminase small subunit
MNAASKAFTHFQSLADRFGMNPSARIKLAVSKQDKKPADPAARYFG